MGLLPGDIDLLLRVSKFATNQPIQTARSDFQTRDPITIAPEPTKDTSLHKKSSTQQPIAHFGEAAKRSSSRPKVRTTDTDNDDAPSPPEIKKNTISKGKLLEEIAAEQMFRPTNAKGAKVIRARELCAQAAISFGAGNFEQAIRDYAEAEALYHAVNDNASIDLVVSKRQEAENSLPIVVFQRKFDRERGQGLLEDGRDKLAKGLIPQAQDILNQAWTYLSKSGDMKLAAESARLRDQADALAAASIINGSKAELRDNEHMLEQPSSLVRSAQELREKELKELERQRALKQEEVRVITISQI
jgi:tetratricopeptide (TPR) repeat protein